MSIRNRELASKYAHGVCDNDSQLQYSPVEFSVNVWRYTNSKRHGIGQNRLLEIAEELFDMYFGDCRAWELEYGYEMDVAEKRDMRLNAIVGYSVERISKSGGIDVLARGVKKW